MSAVYDGAAAARYWGGERLLAVPPGDRAAEDAAVLCQGKPLEMSRAYAAWEDDCLDALLPDLAGRTVLDLGCGVGRLLPRLALAAERVVGVDLAPGMLDRARKRIAGLGNAEVRLGGVDAVDLQDGSVDVVVCFGVFEHVPSEHRHAALAEIARVLKPGGTLLLELNNADSALLSGARADNPHRVGVQWENGYFCELVTVPDLLSAAADVGLDPVEDIANPFYSAVRHANAEHGAEESAALFAKARELDRAFGASARLRAVSDQVVVKAVRR